MELSQQAKRAARRRRILQPVWLVALVGLGAVNVPSAAAGTPEFVLCAKAQPAHSGKYASNSCSDSSFVPSGGQRYEREAYPWAAAKKRSVRESFPNPLVRLALMNPLGKGGGPSDKATVERAVECPREGSREVPGRGSGEVTGPKSVTMSYQFKECALVESPPRAPLSDLQGEPHRDRPARRHPRLPEPGTHAGRLAREGPRPGWPVSCTSNAPAAHLSVDVSGEYLTELTENVVNSASKRSMSVADVGPLSLQASMYEEEAFSENAGQRSTRMGLRAGNVRAGRITESGRRKDREAQMRALGRPSASGSALITLLATVSGQSRERFPATLSNAITRKGDLFLVETS